MQRNTAARVKRDDIRFLRGQIITDLDQADLPETDFHFLCPAFTGLPAETAPQLAVLPIRNINQALLDHIKGQTHRGVGRLYAGVFAVDPLQRTNVILGKLRKSGITGVANFPTISVFTDAFSNIISKLGLGFRRELSFISDAVSEGFTATGCVMTSQQGEMMLDAGASMVVFHYGVGASDNNGTAVASKDLIELRQLTKRRNVPLILLGTSVSGTFQQIAHEWCDGILRGHD